MSSMILFPAVCLVSYLLGSIPFGYVLVRVFRGEDIRVRGSGSTGATNVARSARGLGVLTLLLDAAKGFVAVLGATVVSSRLPAASGPVGSIAALAAVCVIAGHIFPVWLRFRGGKGVATGVGSFLVLAPRAVLIVLGIFLAVLLIFRYVSLGSIAAAACFPPAAFLIYQRALTPATLMAIGTVSLLIVFMHRSNIQRLATGTENRFTWKKG